MKSVIITGAANGIGKSISEKLIQDGFQVHACDIDEEALRVLKTNHANNIEICALDVSNYERVENFFEKFSSTNRPQFLVNNAGIYPAKNILDYTPKEIERVYATNVFSATYFTKLFAKPLIENKQTGVIVNMSSVSEYGGSDAIYGSSKGAISALTRCCAQSLSP